MKISWSGCLPSQLWTCLAQQLANDNEKQMADQNDNEVGNKMFAFVLSFLDGGGMLKNHYSSEGILDFCKDKTGTTDETE